MNCVISIAARPCKSIPKSFFSLTPTHPSSSSSFSQFTVSTFKSLTDFLPTLQRKISQTPRLLNGSLSPRFKSILKEEEEIWQPWSFELCIHQIVYLGPSLEAWLSWVRGFDFSFVAEEDFSWGKACYRYRRISLIWKDRPYLLALIEGLGSSKKSNLLSLVKWTACDVLLSWNMLTICFHQKRLHVLPGCQNFKNNWFGHIKVALTHIKVVSGLRPKFSLQSNRLSDCQAVDFASYLIAVHFSNN